MPVFSYFHQLFNAEQCQAYMHTLRWKDRPLQCPRCHSQDVDLMGARTTIGPGSNGTGVTAASAPSTISLTPCSTGASGQVLHWILATFLLCLSCSSRRIARELGLHSRTSYRWCWWLRNAALSYESLSEKWSAW